MLELVKPDYLCGQAFGSPRKEKTSETTYVVLLVIERHLGQDVARLGIDGEGYVVRREVRDLSVDALVRVFGSDAPDEFAALAFLHPELVRQPNELGILVVDVGHLDVHRRRARQATRVLGFYYLFVRTF